MFLHLSVSHSVHRGCLPLGPGWEGGCLPLGPGGVAASGSGGCLSLGPGGVYHMPPGHTPSGHTSPLVHTPDTPLHTHPWTPPPLTHTPLDTPRHGWIHTHTPDTPLEAHPRQWWPLKRTVRILLECILAYIKICLNTIQLQKIGLQIKLQLENVAKVMPEGDDFRWYIKVRTYVIDDHCKIWTFSFAPSSTSTIKLLVDGESIIFMCGSSMESWIHT